MTPEQYKRAQGWAERLDEHVQVLRNTKGDLPDSLSIDIRLHLTDAIHSINYALSQYEEERQERLMREIQEEKK